MTENDPKRTFVRCEIVHNYSIRLAGLLLRGRGFMKQRQTIRNFSLFVILLFWHEGAMAAKCPYDVVKNSMDEAEYEQKCAKYFELMEAMRESQRRRARGEAPPGGYLCRDVLKDCRGAWNKASNEMWGKPDYWAHTDDLTGESWQQVSWTADSRVGRNTEFGIQCNTSGMPIIYATFSGFMAKQAESKLSVRIADRLFSDLPANPTPDGVSFVVADKGQVQEVVGALRSAEQGEDIIARGWDFNGVASTLKFEVGAASDALKWLPCL